MVEREKALQEIKDGVAEIFKSGKDKMQAVLDRWADRLIDLRKAILSDDPDRVKEAEKSERYAWDGIYAEYALGAKLVEKDAWSLAEKSLKLLRNVLLTP